LGRALRLADQFDAGMVRVNAPTSGVDFHAPFGGAKQSSYGPREQGLAARDFYTETRTVTIVPDPGSRPARFPDPRDPRAGQKISRSRCRGLLRIAGSCAIVELDF